MIALLIAIDWPQLTDFSLLLEFANSGLYFCQSIRAETSVLFELIAHHYERKSLLITANQPFSQWNAIFADDMMTVAAVDRLIHHALIVEIHSESYRRRSAAKRGEEAEAPVSKEDSSKRWRSLSCGES